MRHMKPIIDILEDTLDVLEYISCITEDYKKKKKKLEKMIRLYKEDPEKFMKKYIDSEETEDMEL